MGLQWSNLIAILLAIGLGGAIGFERQMSGKAAGLRTNTLICLGAAMFTLISKQLAGPSDPGTHIAAQIVTGVGFLGAGAIIRDRGGVHGLTTAATIWLVSSVGMACGAHFYGLAVTVAVIAIIILFALRPMEKLMEGRGGKHKDIAR